VVLTCLTLTLYNMWTGINSIVVSTAANGNDNTDAEPITGMFIVLLSIIMTADRLSRYSKLRVALS